MMRRFDELHDPHLAPGRRQEYRTLARAVADLPDVPAPADLLGGVMSRLAPKRLPWWRRALRRLSTPRDYRLTPLAAGAAMAGVAAVCLLGLGLGLRGAPQAPVAAVEAPSEFVQVVFRIQLPEARSVSLVGDFNQWSPAGYEMRPDGANGQWLLSISLPRGRHEYAFLVDYTRMTPDPGALIRHADGFGNVNSVLDVGGAAKGRTI